VYTRIGKSWKECTAQKSFGMDGGIGRAGWRFGERGWGVERGEIGSGGMFLLLILILTLVGNLSSLSIL